MKIVISVVSAIFGGMGLGGGAIFIILSTLFLKFDQVYSQALNLLLFIAVSISATISNIKDKKINFKLFKKTIIFLIVGSLIGTSIASKIQNEKLKNLFSCFMVIVGIYEIITSLIRIKKAKNNIRKK